MSFLLGIKSWFDPEIYFDDYVDRMSRKHIVTALVITIVFLATTEFIGDPISCFVPDYYNGEQAAYINSFCWANSIYYLVEKNGKEKWNDGVPMLGSHKAHSGVNLLPHGGRKEQINYYRWVPVVLMIQCFFFLLPFYIWQALAQSVHGLHIFHVLKGADEIAKVECAGEERDVRCEEVAKRLRIFVDLNKTKSKLQKKLFGDSGRLRVFGGSSALFVSYITSKILALANHLLQLLFLSAFLQNDIWTHCANTVKGVFDSKAWSLSPRFPVTTICEYTGEAQVHGQLLRLTCLCSIPLNLYHDKIFSVMGIFMIIMIVLIPISAIHWLCKCLDKQAFLRRYFLPFSSDTSSSSDSSSSLDDVTPRDVERFAEACLPVDVIFLLRLMEMNADGVVVAFVVEKMWEDFKLRGEAAAALLDDDGVLGGGGGGGSGKDAIEKVPINQMFLMMRNQRGMQNGSYGGDGKMKEHLPPVYPALTPESTLESDRKSPTGKNI